MARNSLTFALKPYTTENTTIYRKSFEETLGRSRRKHGSGICSQDGEGEANEEEVEDGEEWDKKK